MKNDPVDGKESMQAECDKVTVSQKCVPILQKGRVCKKVRQVLYRLSLVLQRLPCCRLPKLLSLFNTLNHSHPFFQMSCSVSSLRLSAAFHGHQS
jgi:hypothetical protein